MQLVVGHSIEVWPTQLDLAAGRRSLTHACQHVTFLHKEEVNLIELQAWLPTVQISIQWIMLCGGLCSSEFICRKFKSVDQLKRDLTLEWGRLSQNFINQSIADWRQHLHTVVHNNGAHSEHCSNNTGMSCI